MCKKSWRRGLYKYLGHCSQPPPRRHMGCNYRQRSHDSRRACRQRWWSVGPRSWSHVRNRTSCFGNGTSLLDDRTNGRSHRVQPCQRQRVATHDRLRRRNLRPTRRSKHSARHIRAEQSSMVSKRNPVGFRVPVAATRSRAHRSRTRTRLCSLPCRGTSRHQKVRQRSIHVLARRQPIGWPNQRHARHVVSLCCYGGPVARWWRGTIACQLDGSR